MLELLITGNISAEVADQIRNIDFDSARIICVPGDVTVTRLFAPMPWEPVIESWDHERATWQAAYINMEPVE